MRCPNCSSRLFRSLPGAQEPWWVRRLVRHVVCDTCLTHYYLLRGTAVLIRRTLFELRLF